MRTSAVENPALVTVRQELHSAMAATKCHRCGCFQDTGLALEGSSALPAVLALQLALARALIEPKRYDCLGCEAPTALYGTVIAEGLISRLDHAAYLGCELARAQHALATGEDYVQDRARGEEDAVSPACSGGNCSCTASAASRPMRTSNESRK